MPCEALDTYEGKERAFESAIAAFEEEKGITFEQGKDHAECVFFLEERDEGHVFRAVLAPLPEDLRKLMIEYRR